MEVLRTGDRSKNPSGSGGFPCDKASASVGKQIVDYKTARIAETIVQVLKASEVMPAASRRLLSAGPAVGIGCKAPRVLTT